MRESVQREKKSQSSVRKNIAKEKKVVQIILNPVLGRLFKKITATSSPPLFRWFTLFCCVNNHLRTHLGKIGSVLNVGRSLFVLRKEERKKIFF